MYIYVYGVYRKNIIKEFRNSSWYQSQFFWNPNPFWSSFIQAIIHSSHTSLAISQSGYLSLWPSLIPAKSLWPSLNPTISLSGHLSFRPSVPVLRPISLVFSSSLFPTTIFGCLLHLHDKIRNDIITNIQRHDTRIRGQLWNSKPWWQWFLSYSHHMTQIKWPWLFTVVTICVDVHLR